jgi:hypothetical protein
MPGFGERRKALRFSALVWGFLSQVFFLIGAGPLPALGLVQFLCSTEGTVSSSRPELRVASRAAAVKTGRRPPPEAARSGLEGGEHGARLGQVGTAPMSLTAMTGLVADIAEPIGGEFAIAPRSFRSNLVFGRSGGIGP